MIVSLPLVCSRYGDSDLDDSGSVHSDGFSDADFGENNHNRLNQGNYLDEQEVRDVVVMSCIVLYSVIGFLLSTMDQFGSLAPVLCDL